VDRRLEDVLLLLLEVPTAHCLLLDLLLGLIVLILPIRKDLLTELDLCEALRRVGHLEDLVQLDLVLDLLADLGRDSLQDTDEVLLLVVDVPGDSPDQFETSE
jgi:hypothetical protein